MNNIETQMEKEALKRIKELQKRFKLDNKMQEFFENSQALALDFTVEEDEETNFEDLEIYSEISKDFKAKYNCLIYYVFIENMHIDNYQDKVMNFLYVSDNPEDWEYERLDPNNLILAYTYNISLKYSEFGSIVLAKKENELGRVG